ncbi:proteasome subunit beta [Candidatus Woesearchaeota archaeon]|nr:proteasome subunit beta [Candidatus Woesearchaeota archaeon]
MTVTEELKDYTRKGTTTVGIKCADGIVLAADKRVTAGGRIVMDKSFNKVFPISEFMAVTIAGTVSDAQLISKLLMAEIRLKKVRTGAEPNSEEAANLLTTIVYQNIRRLSPILGITGFLFAGYDEEGLHLYEIGVDGSLIESQEYVTDGSGFMNALGVLDTLYKKDIKVAEGVKLAVKAINAAIQRDTATGEGIDVYTITSQGVKKVFAEKLNTNITA